jgi:hypothetical protein
VVAQSCLAKAWGFAIGNRKKAPVRIREGMVRRGLLFTSIVREFPAQTGRPVGYFRPDFACKKDSEARDFEGTSRRGSTCSSGYTFVRNPYCLFRAPEIERSSFIFKARLFHSRIFHSRGPRQRQIQVFEKSSRQEACERTTKNRTGARPGHSGGSDSRALLER